MGRGVTCCRRNRINLTAGGGAPSNDENKQKYHSTIWDILLPPEVNQEEMLSSYNVSLMKYAELSGIELPEREQQVYGLEIGEISGSSAVLKWSSAKAGMMRVSVESDVAILLSTRSGHPCPQTMFLY